MQAVHHRSSSSRYLGASVAMATAAAVALAPMSASAAGVSLPSVPPVMQDAGAAATALANWLAHSGMQLVTDPITGLQKLVSDQVGNATLIGGVLTEQGQTYLQTVAGTLPGALESTFTALAAGDPGGAFGEAVNTFTAPMFSALMAGLLPIMTDIYPQLGPIGDGLGFGGAYSNIAVAAIVALAGSVGFAQGGLDTFADTVKALATGDPFAAGQALTTGLATLLQGGVDSLLGPSGVLTQALAIVPAFLKGMAGSSWATSGPLAGLPGVQSVSFVPASASTLAASPTAVPGLPDLSGLPDLWKSVFQMVQDSLAGDYGGGIPLAIETLTTKLPKGDLAGVYSDLHSVVSAPFLPVGMGLSGTIGAFTPALGPLGAGLDAASYPIISLSQTALAAARYVPVAGLTAAQDAVATLLQGDPLGAATTGLSGLAGTLTTATDWTFGANGVVPALITVGQSFTDGVTGSLGGDATGLATGVNTLSATADAAPSPQLRTADAPAQTASDAPATEDASSDDAGTATELPAQESGDTALPAIVPDAPAPSAPTDAGAGDDTTVVGPETVPDSDGTASDTDSASGAAAGTDAGSSDSAEGATGTGASDTDTSSTDTAGADTAGADTTGTDAASSSDVTAAAA